MTRSFGLVVLAAGMLAGCAPSSGIIPDVFRAELPKKRGGVDPDIVALTLRPLPDTSIAPLPQPVEEPDLSLRLRSDYARVQLQWPLLAEGAGPRLTAIARSYVEPDTVDAPRAKFLLRLSFSLWSPSKRLAPRARSWREAGIGSADAAPAPPRAEAIERPGDMGRLETLEGGIGEPWLADGWQRALSLSLGEDDRS